MIFGCAPTTRDEPIDAELNVPKDWQSYIESNQIKSDFLVQFNDPLLKQYIDEAWSQNKDLAAIAASVSQATSLVDEVSSGLLPSAGIEIGANRQQEQGFISDIRNSALQVTWDLDVWGRLQSEREGALNDARSINADFAFAKQAIATNVIKAYVIIIEANHIAKTTSQSEQNLSRIYENVKLLFDEGLASTQDLAISRADLASIRSQLAESNGAVRDAKRALEMLLGRYPSSSINTMDIMPTLPALPKVGIPTDVIARRADLIAAERRVAASFNRLDAAYAARLPSLSITGSFGGISDGFSGLLNDVNRSWLAGATLFAPMFQGGAIDAQIAQANARQEEAMAQYQNTVLKAFNEVEAALDAGIILSERLKELTIAEGAAQEAFRVAKVRFDEGDIELIDLLSIEQRLLARQLDVQSTQSLLRQQRADLYLALGGEW